MRFLGRSLVGLFLLGATLGLLTLAFKTVFDAAQERASRESRGNAARERVYAVRVLPAAVTSVRPQIAAFGEIESRRTLELRAPTGGTITELSPDFVEGGVLEKGGVILRIDAADAEVQSQFALADRNDAEVEVTESLRALTLVENELKAARERETLLKRAYDRQVELWEKEIGTRDAVETAELALTTGRQSILSIQRSVAQAELRIDQARSQLERQEIALAEARRQLDDTTLVAEFSGTLSDVSIVEGGLLSANERIGILIDPGALEVAFKLSNTQYRRLLDNDGRLLPIDVSVGLDLADSTTSTTGRIVREGAAVLEGRTGRLLFAALPDSGRIGLKPGDFVSVTIEEPELHGILVLPAAAIDSDNRILVLNDENRLEDIDADLLRRMGDEVIVRGRTGMAGRLIVAERTPLIGGGSLVKPILPDEGSIETQPEPAMVALGDEERTRLIAMVEGNAFMPDTVKKRILEQLQQAEVPQDMLDRLRARSGG
ncbi:MAG: efflux transporter periplasmic adaptor subunit [Rhodobacteraceae bacterium]|nr:efflux transporter periplasmic adaptor subunit [Paracoccaceae bacterium]